MIRILEKIHAGSETGSETNRKAGSGSGSGSEKIIPDPQDYCER
jgi:hypothetical protein